MLRHGSDSPPVVAVVDLLLTKAVQQRASDVHIEPDARVRVRVDGVLRELLVLPEQSSGAVVSISLSGVDRGGMGFAHSIAARAGVLGMTRSLALEWAADGIRLNCIGPGTVVTAGLADEAAKQLLDTLVAATPLGEPTSVEEVAELVAFLASPAGRLMTGQLIQIDGAAHLGPGLHMLSA